MSDVFTWLGKPEPELTREELLDVITHLTKEAKKERWPCATCELLCNHTGREEIA